MHYVIHITATIIRTRTGQIGAGSIVLKNKTKGTLLILKSGFSEHEGIDHVTLSQYG